MLQKRIYCLIFTNKLLKILNNSKNVTEHYRVEFIVELLQTNYWDMNKMWKTTRETSEETLLDVIIVKYWDIWYYTKNSEKYSQN